MKKTIIKNLCMAALGVIVLSSVANAQHWLASVSGAGTLFSGSYSGNHIAIDAAGNTYTTGTYVQTVTSYGTGQTGVTGTSGFSVTTAATAGSNYKFFITKTSAIGEINWMLGFRTSSTASSSHAVTNTIAVSDITNAEAVYVGGYFVNTINTFSGSGAPAYTGDIASTGGTDGLVIKLSKAGERQWHKVFGGSGTQQVRGVTTDSEGNLIVVGLYTEALTIDGAPALPDPGSTDAFVAKFNKDGAIQFVRSIGGSGTEAIWGVATDVDNAIYVTGSADFGTTAVPITVSITSDPLATPSSSITLPAGIGTNTYIAKFNAGGIPDWGQTVISTGENVGQGIAVDYKNAGERGVYLTGNVSGGSTNINFGGRILPVTGTNTSPYIAKFEAATGAGAWGNVFNANAAAAGYLVAVNTNNEIFAAGYSRDINIDGVDRIAVKNASDSPSEDGYIVKVDPESGAVLARKFIATVGTERVNGLAVSTSAVYANGIGAGPSGGTVAAPTVTENFAGTGQQFAYRGGSWDAFILKWGDITLPVSLTDFKGNKTSLGNLLSWTTQSETDNQYFELERSTDAVNFSQIKRIDGAGNSTEKISYSHLDTNPLSGVNYYRLKQVDKDGSFSYSEKIVAINNQLETEEIKIYPNPGLGIVNVQLPSESIGVEINVYNQMGKLVKSYSDVSGVSHSINISDQAAGIYFIQVIENGKSKMIKYINQ